jgi:uncharacterized membrane-anchored protein
MSNELVTTAPAPTAHPASAPTARTLLNKVPEVTLYFWVIKIMATTVGETAADFLSTTLGLGLTGTSVVIAALLVAALLWQFHAHRYVPATYWTAVVLISVVGTLITDNLTDNLGVSLPTTTAAFAIGLTLVFALWFRSERTLSIHTITTRRRETFYWSAILFTFALGTAAGDLLAEGLDLGYPVSVLLFAAAIALVTFAHRRLDRLRADAPARSLAGGPAVAGSRGRRARPGHRGHHSVVHRHHSGARDVPHPHPQGRHRGQVRFLHRGRLPGRLNRRPPRCGPAAQGRS